MNRVVGAVVVIGMICLGGILARWMERVHPGGRDASPAFDSLTSSSSIPVASSSRARASSPPASFQHDPLAFLSRAPADSLDLIPGIGPVLAARIIEARAAGGGFTSWTQVRAVKGIGPRLVSRWRSFSTRR